MEIGKIDFLGKKVLVRGDLDVDDGDNPRVFSVRKIVVQLLSCPVAQLKVIGHRETQFPICDQLRSEFPGVEFDDGLRTNSGERENSLEFAKELAEGWDVYVNEAFATSHRRHCSIDALPRLMASQGKQVCVGFRFEKEIEMLAKIQKLENSKNQKVFVVGGVKVEDKARCSEIFEKKGWVVLRGGLLPGADLRPDGLDISDKAIGEYVEKIGKADMILAAGVMGKYEAEDSSKGTRTVLSAIAESGVYKVAGGGDIEMAISAYGLTDKFDWISVGGGAMLEYLSSGTLVGIQAVQ